MHIMMGYFHSNVRKKLAENILIINRAEFYLILNHEEGRLDLARRIGNRKILERKKLL